MKTYTKISSLAVVCALCAGASMPASAAPSVRALGGAGTYSSASSATQAKSGTTSSVEKADTVRGGSLAVGDTGATTTTAKKATTTSNVNSGVRGSSVRSASVRVPSTARLSIGKYLGGSTVSRPSMPEKEPTPSVSEDFVEYDIQYNDRTKVLTISERQEDGSYDDVMVRDIASHEDLMDLQELVGDEELDTSARTIIAAINELVSGKQDKLTAGDGIAIDGDMISARVGNGLAIENGVIVTDIEFPDAPIQKEIKAGDGIDVVKGEEFDTVAVNILPDGAGGLIVEDGVLKTKIDLPDIPVQEKLTAGDGISQAVLDTGKIGVNILPDGAGGLKFENGVLKTKIDLPDTPVQEKLNAGTGIKIENNTVSTNLAGGSYIQITTNDQGAQEISVEGLPENLQGFVIYQPGDGVVFDGDNKDVISANTGDGLKIVDDKIKVNISEDGTGGLKFENGVLKTTATLPASGEVQEKLTQGAGIKIENNVVSANLKSGDGILISDEDGAKKIAFDPDILPDAPIQKKIVEGNGITVVPGTDSDTVQIKLADGNSGLEFVEGGGLKVSSDANTTYEAGQGISISADNNAINVNAGNGIAISEDNEIAISANAEGLYLYSFAGGTGTWSMVDVVDENDVADPTPAAE